MPDATFKDPVLGDVSVCYSGGLDSTTVAFIAAKQEKGRVHLHTLNHGYGYPFNSWAGKTAASLGEAIGDGRVIHQFLKTKDLFKDIAMKTLRKDCKTYGQTFGCCLGCTMAMVTKIIIYNLENTIPHIMMGSSVGGTYAVMSMPVTVELQKLFCGQYGVLYDAPLLSNHIVKDVERTMLDKAGVRKGLRFLDKHSFGNQGYCMLSLQHLPDVLFNVHPTYEPDQVKRFFLDRQPRCEQYITDHFKNTGQDLDAAIARLTAITGKPS